MSPPGFSQPVRGVTLAARAALFAALAAPLTGCSDDRRTAGAPIAGTMSGPDAVLLRVPRGGGRVTAVVYPRLDSTVWRSREAAPPLARVLAFDADAGLLAAVDTGGLPVRLDLRLGTARTASRTPLAALAASGGTFYGVDSTGAVTRLTASGGDWKVRLSPVPRALYPQRDGTVLAAGTRGGAGVVWVLRPPTPNATDSVRVPGGARAVRLAALDRVYFAGGDELLAVQGRTLAPAAPVALGAGFRAAAASPSGDRVFVLTDRAGEVRVVDRYAGTVAGTVTLPGEARDLRVDPLGRYLLVRPASGDSAWVVAVGTDRVIGAVRGAWRDDLPLVLPDGAILGATGADVTVVDGETLRPRATVSGGASDFWHLVLWNGFRPRAAGLDQPVTFRTARPEEPDTNAADTAAAGDSATADSTPAAPVESTTAAPVRPTVPPPEAAGDAERAVVRPVRYAVPPRRADGSAGGEVTLAPAAPRAAAATSTPATPTSPRSTPVASTPAASATRAPAQSATPRASATGAQPATPAAARSALPARTGHVYTVQFAAAPTEREARRALARLRLPGTTLRVVPRAFDGQTVYRVVAGPFATRAEADRVGRAAGAGNFWVYGGAP